MHIQAWLHAALVRDEIFHQGDNMTSNHTLSLTEGTFSLNLPFYQTVFGTLISILKQSLHLKFACGHWLSQLTQNTPCLCSPLRNCYIIFEHFVSFWQQTLKNACKLWWSPVFEETISEMLETLSKFESQSQKVVEWSLESNSLIPDPVLLICSPVLTCSLSGISFPPFIYNITLHVFQNKVTNVDLLSFIVV